MGRVETEPHSLLEQHGRTVELRDALPEPDERGEQQREEDRLERQPHLGEAAVLPDDLKRGAQHGKLAWTAYPARE